MSADEWTVGEYYDPIEEAIVRDGVSRIEAGLEPATHAYVALDIYYQIHKRAGRPSVMRTKRGWTFPLVTAFGVVEVLADPSMKGRCVARLRSEPMTADACIEVAEAWMAKAVEIRGKDGGR